MISIQPANTVQAVFVLLGKYGGFEAMRPADGRPDEDRVREYADRAWKLADAEGEDFYRKDPDGIRALSEEKVEQICMNLEYKHLRKEMAKLNIIIREVL